MLLAKKFKDVGNQVGLQWELGTYKQDLMVDIKGDTTSRGTSEWNLLKLFIEEKSSSPLVVTSLCAASAHLIVSPLPLLCTPHTTDSRSGSGLWAESGVSSYSSQVRVSAACAGEWEVREGPILYLMTPASLSSAVSLT